jgi:hypothetical protein
MSLPITKVNPKLNSMQKSKLRERQIASELGRETRLFWVALALYLLGLVWGYARLPWAGVKSLADYRLIAAAPAVSFDEDLEVSPLQRRYLQWVLPESPTPVVPRLSTKVRWNAIVVARVTNSHVVGNTGAEWQDGLYICVFGAWIHVYTFSHKMA